jgi:Saccharopine dehydrogenase NADP binding domain
VTRIVILGGRGWFGGAAVDRLRRDGERPLVASRRPGGDLRVDAEDPASMRASLRAGDVVIDAAGPFQRRSTVLVETCLTLGCDVIDLSESLDYAQRLQRLALRIESAGTRVLTSCSSVSAVSAALVRLSGVDHPVRVSVFLAPATRNTSTTATAQALLLTLKRPIRVRRAGEVVDRAAFSEERKFTFPPPVGSVSGRLGESPDGLLLPLVWPTLRDVDFWIDTRSGALNALLASAARHRPLLLAVGAMQSVGRKMTKCFGARSGGYAVEAEDASGMRAAVGFVHATHSYLVAVAPAVLAARAIAAGRFRACGLVRPDRYVDPQELVAWLERAGVRAFGPR